MMDYGWSVKARIVYRLLLFVPAKFGPSSAVVVKQFPKRMASGDMQFLHTFAFMFSHFKAAAYWYILFVVARNLLFALTPI